MTVENIMSFRLVKLKPTDRVCDALRIMHERQIRNLPVVKENDEFVGLFGIRPLIRLLLPKASQIDHGLKDLNFMPDSAHDLYDRLQEIGEKPVSDFLEKKKHLTFCKPSTSFPAVMELLDQNPDSSLPVIVLKGKHRKLVGMVSAWDVLEKLLMDMVLKQQTDGRPNPCARPDDTEHKGQEEPDADQAATKGDTDDAG